LGDSPSESYRQKYNSIGEFEYSEPFFLTVPKFYYEYTAGKIIRRDTIDGNIIWERPHSGWVPNLAVTNSGVVILTYVTPNLNSGQGFIRIFDRNGNLKFERTYSGPERKNTVSAGSGSFDGSFFVGSTSSSGWSPQGSTISSSQLLLFDPNGNQLCSCSTNPADAWITRVSCDYLLRSRFRGCVNVRTQSPGANTNDLAGTYFPCIGFIPREKILQPTVHNSTTHLIDLKDGGLAYIKGNTMMRIYCGNVNFWEVSGRLYSDENNNCKIDLEDIPIPNLEFEIDGAQVSTDANGDYNTTINDRNDFKSNYSFGPEVLENWVPCDSDGSFDVRLENISQFDILLTKKEKIVDKVTVDIGSSGTDDCEAANYQLFYCNYGLKDIDSFDIKVQIPEFAEFLNSDPLPSSIIDDNLIYSIDSLQMNTCKEIDLNFRLSCDSIPIEEIEITTIAQLPDNSDTTVVSIPNTQPALDFQITSFLPEISQNAGYDIEIGESIIYQINFQNTSLDSVRLNGIRLLSSNNLDFGNLKIISSSHPFLKTSNPNFFNSNFYLSSPSIDLKKSKGYLRVLVPPNNTINPKFQIITSAFANNFGISNNDTLTVGPNIIQENFIDTTICGEELAAVERLKFQYLDNQNVILNNFNSTILPGFKDTISITVCYPEIVDTFGIEFRQSALREVIYEGQNGCDSTYVLDITIEKIETFHNLRLCESDTIIINGIEYTFANQLERVNVIHQSAFGCDSLVKNTLLFHQEFFQPNVFEADAFPDFFEGVKVYGDTIWQENYLTRWGCDSIISFQVVDISRTSAVTQLEFDNLKVYPNPTKGQLTLDFESIQKGNFNVKITNIYGKQEIIESEEIQLGENSLNFNTERLQSGVFFISIENPRTGATKFVSKFVKI